MVVANLIISGMVPLKMDTFKTLNVPSDFVKDQLVRFSAFKTDQVRLVDLNDFRLAGA